MSLGWSRSRHRPCEWLPLLYSRLACTPADARSTGLNDRRKRKVKNGRPSLTPGIYFRCLLIGYFEGIDSERGIAWRVADSLGLRQFLQIGLDEHTPDHSTIPRTRRL